MIKKIIIAGSLFALSHMAVASCPNALPVDNANFCPSFKSVATCYCTSSGLPSFMCQNMNTLYGRMMSIFGSLQKACEYQKYTSTEDCINNWNCYRLGGVDSHGNICSSTYKACQ